MKTLIYKAYLAGVSEVPVLILGESGSEQEMLAKWIHKSSSRQHSKLLAFNAPPFLKIAETIFGCTGSLYRATAEKGIFLENHGGTVFLDEIGDLSLTLQAKILRFLQEGEIQRVGDEKTFKADVRLIFATHKNLMQMVKEGRFREDLYYRISVAALKVPPLRQRKEDILPLARHFLKVINEEFQKISKLPYTVKTLTPEAEDFLQGPWPAMQELLSIKTGLPVE